MAVLASTWDGTVRVLVPVQPLEVFSGVPMVVILLVRRALTPLTKFLVQLHPPSQMSPMGHQNLNHSSVAQMRKIVVNQPIKKG